MATKREVEAKPVESQKLLLEEINKTNGFTPRVERLKDAWVNATSRVSSDRGYYYMESWKLTEGEHESLRVAKMFANWCEKCRINIADGELLVGHPTHWPRGTQPRPDHQPVPLLNRLNEVDEKLTTISLSVTSVIEEYDLKRLQEACNYFKEYFEAKPDARRVPITSPFDRAHNLGHFGFSPEPSSEGQVLGVPQPPLVLGSDQEKVLALGYNGIITEIEERIAGIQAKDREDITPENLESIEVMKSWIVALKGMITYSHRHAVLAREKAARETDPKRKKELLKIADVCENVPANPARDFHEALQAHWYIHIAQEIEKTGANALIGRLDQYCYHYYEKSINEGIHTRQEAAELLGCMYVKWQSLETFTPWIFLRWVPGSYLANLNIGGFDRRGKDASNELSCLLLHVAKQVKTNQPHVSLMYHRATAPELVDKAIECTREHGGGIPAWFNARVVIEYLLDRGIPHDVARHYGTIVGCVNIKTANGFIYDRAGGWAFVNHAKLLELALNNGADPLTGFQLGPATGDPRNFKTYEELEEAYRQQVDRYYEYWLRKYHGMTREMHFANAAWVPYSSPINDNCISKALDLAHGGMRYYNELCGGGGVDRAQGDASDSMMALKKVVFEDKSATMDEVLQALKDNFEGHDELRKKLMSAPKYGNDDDEVDSIMVKWWDYTKDKTKYYRNFMGNRMAPHRQGAGWAQMAGKVTGALPNGRLAGTSLADAAVSPCQGADKKGPTAVLNSVAKLDVENLEAPLLNMRLTPGPLKTKEGMKKFEALIATFFDKGAAHVQFTVLNRDTLLDAKAHPENYRNLVVRVAGYSAFWVELPENVQDEIISRSEHDI